MVKKKQALQKLEPAEQIQPVAQSLTAEQLIVTAIEKGTPVATMERLLAMRDKIKAEQAKEAYVIAMSGFQSNCPQIVKTKEVKTKTGVVAYRYAPIESIVEQVKPYLEQYGFSFSNGMELLENGVKVSVKVTHKAGHSEVSEMTVPLGNKTEIMSASQVTAAAQTFAKRYAFCNAFGIMTADEDTDAAPPKEEPKAPVSESAPAAPSLASDAQRKLIFALGKDLGKEPEDLKEWVKTAFKLGSFTNITSDMANKVISALQKKVEEKIAAPAEEKPTEEINEQFKSDVIDKAAELNLTDWEFKRVCNKVLGHMDVRSDVEWRLINDILDKMAGDKDLLQEFKGGK